MKKMKDKPELTEDIMIEILDKVENAAYDLACAITGKKSENESNVAEEILPWDMNFIGEIAEDTFKILKEKGKEPCYPFYEDSEDSEIICAKSENRCPWCSFKK